MSATQLNIKLYGGLRQFADRPEVTVTTTLPQTVQEIKKALQAQLKPEAAEILEHSVLATDQEVLGTDSLVEGALVLAALPPVCGG
ncbi:MAG: hypothetical protein OXR68_00340 [Alphaproteobacteria bacterium]|nr:hypothetical protein [Alphaproteobacteria bacterium]MDD9919059.1 hypothetical protein [Alphaproteobacteria bacterium]